MRGLAASAALLLAACGSTAPRLGYSPPAPAPSPQGSAAAETGAVTVAAPFDGTWSAVVQTLFERNLPVDTAEKDSGLVQTGELAGEIGEDCDCGSYLGVPVGGYGTYGGDARYTFQVLVERAGSERTSVTVRSRCRASVESIEGELSCRLDPKRERELRDAILARAK